MKLLKEIPELEDKIQKGDLKLTHIGQAAKTFKK